MRDYAELVKALRYCSDHAMCFSSQCEYRNAPHIGSCFAFLKCNAADAIEELLAAVPHWISVEERLPEKFICVFATDGEDVGIAAFQGFIDDYPVWSNAWNLEYIEDQYDEDFLQVTHWMPLPDPAEGGATWLTF